MRTVSRRGFIVLGGAGAAGATLSACGTADDPREEGRDPELLAAARDAETAVQVAASAAAGQGPAQEGELVAAIAEASSARGEQLRGLAAHAGASEPQGGATTRSLGDALSDAIAAYHAAVGLLSTEELRASMTGFLVEAAAELAALRGIEGDDQVPYAFVTGLPERPAQAASEPATTNTTETTTGEKSSTTSTTEGG